MKDQYLFVEKYRPTRIADCILPERIKSSLQEIVNRKKVPNMLFSGGPGVGKTTAAKCICDEIGITYLFMNASEERGIDAIRDKVVGFASTSSLLGGSKVIILDEADKLTTDAQGVLRGVIEEFSGHCTFIMTCNFKSKIMEALQSRLPAVDFDLSKNEKVDMATSLFKRIKQILKIENIEYEDSALATIINEYFPDYRRILGEIQRLSHQGKIDHVAIARLGGVNNIDALYAVMKKKDFDGIRKWVAENGDIDSAKIYRTIYDSLSDTFKEECVPVVIIILAKYQYWAAFVVDQEINLASALTEIMIECDFK
jgi:DNA polymerase III delta prime subunit